jgi:hypothetical protein
MSLDRSAMQSQLVSYFTAEKREAVLLVAVGIAALVASALLLRGTHGYRGMLIPLVLVGAIQLSVGGAVLVRTDAQVTDLSKRLTQNPAILRRMETARMDRVMERFRVYKIVEIFVLGVGIFLALVFRHGSALHAAGIGCIAQGSLMLVMDLIAEGRGEQYLAALATLPK